MSARVGLAIGMFILVTHSTFYWYWAQRVWRKNQLRSTSKTRTPTIKLIKSVLSQTQDERLRQQLRALLFHARLTWILLVTYLVIFGILI